MLIYQSELLVVHYEEVTKQIQLTCTGNIDSKDLKKCYRRALKFAKDNKVKHWLFDFSRNYDLTEEDQIWLDTTFFPSLMIALGPENYIGMVIPKYNYRQLFKEVGQVGMQTYNSFIKIKTFCSSPKAT
ncbi:MAG TPA: hypothetical protein VK927_04390, partial [Adhaeribacter sp.]|nr:hypothetical protein [Adhaeribacter sp.]